MWLAQVGPPAISIDQIITFLGAGSPFAIMTVMWYLERTERIRLQGVVEGFLPTARSLARTSRALTRVMTGHADGGEGDQ